MKIWQNFCLYSVLCIRVCFRVAIFLNIALFIYKFIYFSFSLILIYSVFILTFFLFIFRAKKNKNITNVAHMGNYQINQEFILFKLNLYKIYYATIIILSYFLFKLNCLNYLLGLNFNFILILTLIFFFYLFLFSNYFTFNLYNLFKEIKICLSLLNEIDLDYTKFNNVKKYNRKESNNKNKNKPQSKSFSTSAINYNINEIDSQLFDLDLSDQETKVSELEKKICNQRVKKKI